jgi:hypothetical protein
MKKTIVILFCFACFSRGLSAEENPLNYCLGYFYLPKTEELFGIADAYLPATLTGAKNYRSVLSTALLRNTKIDSFDLNQDLLYLRLPPKSGTRSFLYRAHVKDKALFMTGFGKNIFGGPGFQLKEETRNQGIEEYLEEKTEFDREAYLKALEKGNADPGQFQKKAYYSIYVAFQNDIVFVSGDREMLKRIYKHPPEFPVLDKSQLLLFLRPARILETYQADIDALKNKFHAVLFSSEETMAEIYRIVESNLAQMDEVTLQLQADQKQMDMDLILKPSDNSKFSSYLSQDNRNTDRLKAPLPANTQSVLAVWMPSLSIQKGFLESRHPQASSLVSNYFLNCEGLFKLYVLRNQKKFKGFISTLIKKGLESQAKDAFVKLFRTVYKAEISSTDSEIQTVQLPKKRFYHQYSGESQWFGLGLDSPDDFKTHFSAVSAEAPSNPEFQKMVQEFPDSLMLFFYCQAGDNEIMAAYGLAEKENLKIHLRILGPHQWLNKISTKKQNSPTPD